MSDTARTRRRDRAQSGIDRSIPIKMGAIAVLLLAAAAAAVVLIFRFIDSERERELLNWQARLTIVADSRAAAVEHWIGQGAATVGGLEGQEALKLYPPRTTE